MNIEERGKTGRGEGKKGRRDRGEIDETNLTNYLLRLVDGEWSTIQ
jgi:hypothetical protein